MKKAIIALAFFVALFAGTYRGALNITGPLTYQAHTVCITVPASEASNGATATTRTTLATFVGQSFNSNNDEQIVSWEIPADYVASTPVIFKIYWTNQPGDALLDTETVIWVLSYRVIVSGGLYDNGTAAAPTTGATWTQVGGGTDKAIVWNTISFAYNDTNQPLASDRLLSVSIKEDNTGDTYSGNPLTLRFELCYQSNGPTDHI